MKMRWRAWIMTIFVIVVVFLKIMVVSENEIIALPDDSAGFVKFVHFGITDLGPPVGYPIWLMLGQLLGVPQRLAVELLYILSCWLLCRAAKPAIGQGATLALFALLVFSPVTFHLFDHALSDSLYVSLVILGVALSVRLLHLLGNGASPGGLLWLGLGSVLGYMAIVRNESQLLLVWAAWLALLCLWILRQSPSRRYGQLIRGGALATGVALSLANSPAVFHGVVDGVWGSTMSQMPSHMRLLRNLASIDVRPRVRYISVSSQARALAYAHSPTLAGLRDTVERADSPYVLASQHQGGLPAGEIGNGWIWHVFNDAAIQQLPNPRTVGNLSRFWDQVNAELEAAFSEGRLQRRSVVHPLIAGDLGTVFASMPVGILQAYRKIFDFMPAVTDQGFAQDIFDEVCLRRTHLVKTSESRVSLRGWVLPVDASVVLLGVQVAGGNSSNGVQSWMSAHITTRDDVSAAFSNEWGRAVHATGFELSSVDVPPGPLTIRYLTNRGVVTDGVGQLGTVQRRDIEGSEALLSALDHLERTVPSQAWIGLNAQSALAGWEAWSVVLWLGPFVPIFALVGGASRSFGAHSENHVRQPWIALLFIFGIVIQRLTFYGVMDELAWQVEHRYVAPLFALLIVLLIISVMLLRVRLARTRTP
ncbi:MULTISPECIES: hypothetical protein [Hyphomicrobiales]|uniref:hypothetical protein n=1 Tax=Methylobacterium sp. CCH7-A2 TaxID=1768789 RepID=UPI0008368C18|nr:MULTISPECIES: hypothetical protein [Hyphomicrobiales]